MVDCRLKRNRNLASCKRRNPKGNKCDIKRIKKFVDNSMIEVHITEGKLMGVGLQRGQSKILQREGFSRKEQIKILDCLEENPKLAKKLLKF